MANISNEIRAFQNAVYGEEVRSSMISAIQKINTVTESCESTVSSFSSDISSATTAANDAASNANTAATAANTAATAANTAKDAANTATSNANAATTSANNAASNASAAATSANNAEAARVTAENERANAESTRQANESARQSAEQSRVSAEATRTNSESARDSAESARQTNEITRQGNERQRQNSETLRESAESSRVSGFSDMQAAFANMQRTVIPQATESTMGGVVVGSGLNVDNALLSLATTKSGSGTSVFSNGSYLESLTVYGESAQDGTPTPDSPVPVEVVEGPLSLVIGDTSVAIDLQGNALASLPDGTRDELHVDSAGHVWIEKRTGHTTQAVTDGVTGTVGTYVLSSTGQIADGADVWYRLAKPQTIDLGYIDIPAIPNDATISVSASMTPVIDASWWERGAEAITRTIKALSARIRSFGAIAESNSEQIAIKANVSDVYSKSEVDAEIAAMLDVRIPEFGDGLALDDDTLSVDLETADGVLPVAHGGTGLAASPSALVDLASSDAANMMQASPRPGVTGTLPIANGGTGATTVEEARTALGLGSLATRSSLGLVITAEDGTVKDSSARSSGANYRIDITLEPMSGYTPIAAIAVSADSVNARLRGFDLDGVSTGGTPKVKTYWNASGDMSANTVTYFVQVLMVKTTLP